MFPQAETRDKQITLVHIYSRLWWIHSTLSELVEDGVCMVGCMFRTLTLRWSMLISLRRPHKLEWPTRP